MNVEHINPFIQGSQSILNAVCMEDAGLGKLYAKKPPYKSDDVAIVIGLRGQITGHVIYNMTLQTACNIASKMMMGMPVDALDEMSTSAISELTNMISGNVATLFSSHGVLIDITTPTFIATAKSHDFSFVNGVASIICVPLLLQGGNVFEIDIAIS